MLVVALAGVAVNLAATARAVARRPREPQRRGAFLHVATDLAAFVGTAIAGALVLATGWDRFDPIAGLLVAALMVRSSWSLLRESGRIFLEGVAGRGSIRTTSRRALVADRTSSRCTISTSGR